MIITELNGGLGNQMFQYAIGRSLSQRLHTDLLLDIRQLQVSELRKYQLNNFNINANLASENDIEKIANPSGLRLFIQKLKSKFVNPKYFQLPIIKEPSFIFDTNFRFYGNNSFLSGYWQSYMYFNDIRETIIKDFTVNTKLSKENKELLEKIQKSNAVSLHVRRGDYVNNPVTNAYHGTCSLEYYQKAIDLILAKEKDAVFFVFSDDPEWTKKNLSINALTYFVDVNTPDTGFEDLRLMYNCRHFIIANSSFSWWGAWLATNENKSVIAPKLWFTGASHDTKDLIPSDWIRI